MLNYIDFVNDKICTLYPPHLWPQAPERIFPTIYRRSNKLRNFKDEIHQAGASRYLPDNWNIKSTKSLTSVTSYLDWIDVNRIQAVEFEMSYMQCQIDMQVN